MERNNGARARECEGQEEKRRRPNWEARKIKRNRQRKVARKASSLPSCFVWISLDASRQQTEEGKGGGLTRRGERWRQTRGMTCLHKKGKEIRNLNYCGMRMALWHQFSWQPENSAACMLAHCANASRLRMKEEEEKKMKVGEKNNHSSTMFREEE